MKHLRHWRKRAGLSQIKLAELLKVSDMTIYRWEKGDGGGPDVSDIQKLCSVLNITEAELLNGPQATEISVKLKFGSLEEVNKLVIDTSNINNRFDLVMSGKSLGIAGIAQFKDDEDFENTLNKICTELREGWEFIKKKREQVSAKPKKNAASSKKRAK